VIVRNHILPVPPLAFDIKTAGCLAERPSAATAAIPSALGRQSALRAARFEQG